MSGHREETAREIVRKFEAARVAEDVLDALGPELQVDDVVFDRTNPQRDGGRVVAPWGARSWLVIFPDATHATAYPRWRLVRG